MIIFPLVFRETSSRSSHKRCSVKKVFFWKVQRKTPVLESLFKKRPWHSCFPMNFANSLKTSFLTERLRWLLLYVAFWMRTCSARTLALKAIRKINSRMNLFCKKNLPANIYQLKVNNRKSRKGVKYIQTSQKQQQNDVYC